MPRPQPSGPRSRAERRRDTEQRLQHDVDLGVATAATDGSPHLVPLSFDRDGEAMLMSTSLTSLTGTNLAATGAVRLALGGTRDVTLVDGVAAVLALDALPAEQGDRFAVRTDLDPRTSGPRYRWFQVRPRRIQAWREGDELPGRELVRDGRWRA
ncbi:hypothetical protein GCM10009616_25290 [Microlunatus lacustris]